MENIVKLMLQENIQMLKSKVDPKNLYVFGSTATSADKIAEMIKEEKRCATSQSKAVKVVWNIVGMVCVLRGMGLVTYLIL